MIQYRSGIIKERQRFTIFHELAHTCFGDAFEKVRKQTFPSEGDDPAERKFEQLCDIGAGELLMPYEDFSCDLGKADLSAEHANSLASLYVASVEATMKRAVDITTEPCAAVFLSAGAPQERFGGRVPFKVQWCWPSQSFSGFISKGTLAPSNSIAGQVVQTSSPASSPCRETWWIHGKPRSYYVSATAIQEIPGKPDYPRVACIFRTRVPK